MKRNRLQHTCIWNYSVLWFSFVSIILQALQTFTYRFKNKSNSCESQAHHFTGKSEQNITGHAKKDDSLMVWHPRVVRGAMHSGKKCCSALWLNAMHSGKKWWIWEFRVRNVILKINSTVLNAQSSTDLYNYLFRIWTKEIKVVVIVFFGAIAYWSGTIAIKIFFAARKCGFFSSKWCYVVIPA